MSCPPASASVSPTRLSWCSRLSSEHSPPDPNSATKLSPRRSSQLAAATESLAQNLPSVAVFAVGYALAVEVVSIGAMLLFGRDFSFTTDLFAICAAGILACALWALLGAGVALLTGSSMAGALSVNPVVRLR